MEASRAADCYGSSPDYSIEIADAEQALSRLSSRARLAGYAFLPRNVLLDGLSFVALSDVGFLPVSEEWPSCYFHPKLKLYLVIYVDDIKLAGPTCNLKSGWSLLQKCLTIETPVPVGVYLGCGHEVGRIKVGGTLARTM
eukprot:15312418-Heterocapsa_arctica.AAC.1